MDDSISNQSSTGQTKHESKYNLKAWNTAAFLGNDKYDSCQESNTRNAEPCQKPKAPHLSIGQRLESMFLLGVLFLLSKHWQSK